MGLQVDKLPFAAGIGSKVNWFGDTQSNNCPASFDSGTRRPLQWILRICRYLDTNVAVSEQRAVRLNVMPRLCSHSHQPNNLSCKLKLTSHLLKLQNKAPPEKLNQIQNFFHYGDFPTKTFYVDIFFYTNANFILVKFWNKSLQISMLRRKCALIFLLDILVYHVSF